MSIVTSLLGMIAEEMQKHGAEKLISVRLRCGAISNVVPEALEMAFEVMTEDEPFFKGARLDLIVEPLLLACGECGREFTPGEPGVTLPSPFAPCPFCGHEFTHTVLSGKGMYLEHIEAE